MAELSEKRKKMIFAAGFATLILLSMDFWNWNRSMPLILGMPFWVIWDLCLVLASGIYFMLLSRYLWRD